MSFSNGRASRSSLARITVAANGQQAYLRKDAARAFMAMNAESVRRYGVTLRVTSARTAYRPLADQWYFWNLYRSGRGALAAYPGTSNHGLGIAVDLASPQMRRIVDAIGAKYGWSKSWSDAPSEWWHIRWRPGNYSAVSHYRPTRTLRLGMRGKDVRKVKAMLHTRGFLKGKIRSSFFNVATRRAVRAFQKANHLKADGIVGPKTLRKLRHAASKGHK